jgi:hypothetical protein
MSDKEKNPGSIDDLEIEALSDEDLDAVAGGAEPTSTSATCSCMCCFGGTNPKPTEPAPSEPVLV